MHSVTWIDLLFFVCVDLPGFSCRDRHSSPLFFFGSLLSKPERNQWRSSTSPSRTEGKRLISFATGLFQSTRFVDQSALLSNKVQSWPASSHPTCKRTDSWKKKHYCRNYRVGWGRGGTLHHMHVLLTQKAQCARMETKVGFWSLLLFKTNKSKRMESLTIFKHICQLWCFPLLYRIPGPSEHVCVLARQSVLGLAAQGACLNRLWLTHTRWWCGQRDPGCHAHTHTHANTVAH